MNLSRHLIFTILSLLLLLLVVSCGENRPSGELKAFVNATIWNGIDTTSIENAGMLVRDDRVYDVLSMTDWEYPDDIETIDLDGNYVIPGLINAHGHAGIAKGLQTGPEIHSEENVIKQLRLYARYGITSVVSLGDEPAEAFRVRDTMNPSEEGMARLYLAGPVLNPASAESAFGEVETLMELNPDWTKIRVDDNLGRSEKMPEEVYSKLIEASHQFETPLAAHIVDLEDAKSLLENNADLIAHSVRNQPVDEELIDLMLERDICITPTLTREVSVFIYADRPDFFDDPFFLREADERVLEELLQPEVQERYTGVAADFYRDALPLAIENMMTLHNAGVRVALGTDSGPPARFQGYFEHMEMEMMQDAGMLPGEILLAATRHAAACMQIDDQAGTLQPGKQADFVVLESDPFQDILNLREIHSVYIGGRAVEM